jgi:acyl carrier protein
VNDATIRDELFATLTAVAPEADPTTADPTAPLQDELDLDSMDMLNVIAALSERLGVDVPERDYDQLTTIDGFVAYLQRVTA